MDQSGRGGARGVGWGFRYSAAHPLPEILHCKVLYKASYAHMNTKCLQLISRRKKKTKKIFKLFSQIREVK